MTIKRNFIYVLSLLISVLFVSCWDNFEERSYYSANINAFSFGAHDTCPGIENFVFNIDQYHGDSASKTSGTIMNLDSLPYGSVVKALYPKVTFQSTNGNIYINDSLWEDGDSIDFSSPVVLSNTSYDGLYTKSYSIIINVHQVDPDSMSLEPMSASLPEPVLQSKVIEADNKLMVFAPASGGGLKLFQSSDMCKSWSSSVSMGLTGVMDLSSLCLFGNSYYVKSVSHVLFRSVDGLSWASVSPHLSDGSSITLLNLYGEISRKYKNDPEPYALIGMLQTASGERFFGRSIDGVTWLVGSKVPAKFPSTEFARIKSKTATNVEFVTVAGGKDEFGTVLSNVWSTEDGTNWISVNDGSLALKSLPKRKNASLFQYNGVLVSFGGQDENGQLYKDLHVSPDHGMTWSDAEDNWRFLKMSDGMAGAGIYVQHITDPNAENDREFFWIFGGTRSDGASGTVWKGYLNSMVFDRR